MASETDLRKLSPSEQQTLFYPNKMEMGNRFHLHQNQTEILRYLAKKNAKLEWLLEWSGSPQEGTLSDLNILRHMIAGNVIIHPFDHRLLQPHGYDVTLGKWYWRQNDWQDDENNFVSFLITDILRTFPTFNPFSPKERHNLWTGPFYSEVVKPITLEPVSQPWRTLFEILKIREMFTNSVIYDNLNPGDCIIPMGSSEMVLGHTEEFIGGKNIIATRISGRSSVGRSMLEVCSDANLGVTGWFGRYVLELMNKSALRRLNMIVGEPVATVQFVNMGPGLATYTGPYQDTQDLNQLISRWKPESMLPHLKRVNLIK